MEHTNKIKQLLKENRKYIRNSENIVKNSLSKPDKSTFFDMDIIGGVVNQKNDPRMKEQLIFSEINNIKQLYNSRLRNMLLIKNTEIPFNHIGSEIYEELFKPDEKVSESKLKNIITRTINEFFPNKIVLKDIIVQELDDIDDEYNKKIQINVTYEIPYVGNNLLDFTVESLQLEN